MPDINPSAGDLIEVTIYAENNGVPSVVLAKIMTRDKSEKWQIELAGIPTMRSLIEISNYEWRPEFSRWVRKPEVEKPTLKFKSKMTPEEVHRTTDFSLDF